MLASLYFLGIACCGVSYLTKDFRKTFKIKGKIYDSWEDVIKGCTDSKSEDSFELTDIDIKSYGFDATIEFKKGTKFSYLRSLQPNIESAFGGEVRFILNKDKTSANMIVHLDGLDIEEKEEIYFLWDKIFSNKNKVRNTTGETYKIEDISDIYVDGEVAGYRLKVNIPLGLSYEVLEDHKDLIDKSLGKSTIKWDDDLNRVIIDIEKQKVNFDYNFKPVKVEPYELCVGLGNFKKNIILNFKKLPNALIGGIPCSGKSIAVMTAIMNSCLSNGKEKLGLFFNMLTDKQDFRPFKNIEQCCSYSQTLESCIGSLERLKNEHKRRNSLFNKCKENITNIYSYNKIAKNKLPVLILIIDEIANFKEDDSDSPDIKAKKKKYNKLLNLLCRESRNSGIYVVVLSQRAGEDSIGVSLRGFLCNKICFKQNTKEAAYTILGNDEAAKKAISLDIDKRMFIYENIDGIDIGRSFIVDDDIFDRNLQKFKVKKTSRFEEKFKNKAKSISYS